MPAQLLLGEPIAQVIRDTVREKVAWLSSKGKKTVLASVQVGENPSSRTYVRSQKTACEAVGIEFHPIDLPVTATQAELLALISKLNSDAKITGIILQSPIPPHIILKDCREAISPIKDAEGITPCNLGRLVLGDYSIAPCTSMAAYEIMRTVRQTLKHTNVTIIGHSETVGKPLSLLMLTCPLESATTTVCHIATKDLREHTLLADVIFSATGKAGILTGDMIKEGAIVIDIGINFIKVTGTDGTVKNKMVGDVAFDEAMKKCSYITPVPGGVGPVTVAMLMKNTAECAARQI